MNDIPFEVPLVDGWLFEGEAALLYTIAAKPDLPGCIVEIGSYHGRSTLILATAAKPHNRTVYAIDPHAAFDNGVDHYGPQDRAAFLGNVVRTGLAETIAPVGLPSAVVAKGWREPIGMLWIDGAHEYEAVREDIEQWTPYVNSGGYIAFHDTGHADVSRAINEWLAEFPDITIVDRVDSTLVVQLPPEKNRDYMRPDVSVLIPAYNCADTLERAVKSAFNQEGVAVQIIIVDDCSTDATQDVIVRLNANQQLTVGRHIENMGLAATLNDCAALATGRYLIELDSDDWLAYGCLAKMVKALDEHPEIGFVYGQTQYHELSDLLFTPQPYQKNIFRFGFASLYAFMYRREAWDNGCRYRTTCEIEGRKITIQDWDFALQLTEHLRWDALALRDVPVLHYTYRKGSLTDFTQLHNAEVVKAFQERWPIVQIQRI